VTPKPCPTELTTPLHPERGIDGHRNLFCVHYDACLDEAVKQGWGSFGCSACALTTVQSSPGEGIEDYAQQRRGA
jgi:hypothetical protein